MTPQEPALGTGAWEHRARLRGRYAARPLHVPRDRGGHPSSLAGMLCAALLAACSRRMEPGPAPSQAVASAPASTEEVRAPRTPTPLRDDEPVPSLPPTRLPAAPRVVAIGDVHGDLHALRAALRLAGAIDAEHHWIGGALLVVQTGDLLDRGDDDRAILDWVPVLAAEARRAGGGFYALNGNHELMNVQGDFRYVTRGGYEVFRGAEGRFAGHPALARLPAHARARAAAFAPGGTYARLLATMNTVLIVGDTAFVHGGLLPQHVRYGLEELNLAVRAWALGDRAALPPVLEGEESPVWFRGFSLRDDAASCAQLQAVLAAARLRRLVVGHTVQDRGVTQACDGRVWRIDVGLARYYRGPTQALELRGDEVRILGAALSEHLPGLGRDGAGPVRASVEHDAPFGSPLDALHGHPHRGLVPHAPASLFEQDFAPYDPRTPHDCAAERPLSTTTTWWRS